MPKKNLSLILGQLLMFLLTLMGVASIPLAVPQLSNALASRYSEFAGEALTIQILTTIPILLTIAVFIEVIYLQRLVHSDRMFTPKAFKWVRLLAITPLALGSSFILLGTWLALKQALPPAVFLALSALTIFCLAVSMITFSLLGLLRHATSASEELDGVV